MEKTKLIWFAEAVTPYMEELFIHLASLKTLDMSVHFRVARQATAINYPWNLSDSPGYSRRFFISGMIDLCALMQVMRQKDAVFILAGIKGLTKKLILILLVLFRRRFFYVVDALPFEQFGGLKGRFRKLIYAFVLRYATLFLTGGAANVKLTVQHLGSAKKVRDFCYFLDQKNRRTNTHQEFSYNDPLRIVSSGILIYRKGFDVLIRAVAKVVAAEGRKSVFLTIVGEGEEKDRLLNLARELGVEENILFAGWKQPDEIEAYYLDAHLFVFASRHDAYGVVVMEAMAAGKPVIGSSTTRAVVDVVQDGYNGFVIPNEDVDGFAEKIRYFCKHPATVHEMGINARETSSRWAVERAGVLLMGFIGETDMACNKATPMGDGLCA